MFLLFASCNAGGLLIVEPKDAGQDSPDVGGGPCVGNGESCAEATCCGMLTCYQQTCELCRMFGESCGGDAGFCCEGIGCDAGTCQ